MINAKPCPECGGKNLFTTVTSSGPVLLPQLGNFFIHPEFQVVVCADCGLTRLFAAPKARAKLASKPNWQRVGNGEGFSNSSKK